MSPYSCNRWSNPVNQRNPAWQWTRRRVPPCVTGISCYAPRSQAFLPKLRTWFGVPRNGKSSVDNLIISKQSGFFCKKSTFCVRFLKYPRLHGAVIFLWKRQELCRDQRLLESPENWPESAMTQPAQHLLNHQNRRSNQVRPVLEQLEARRLLAADLQLDYVQPTAVRMRICKASQVL